MEKISELQDVSLSLHTGKEAEGYADEGVSAYTDIGQMYSTYLTRDKGVRSDGYERS